jgi:hypothetical protein
MTKREHDAATQINYGTYYGNRTEYRQDRGKQEDSGDYFAARRRSVRSGLGVLDRGSKYRTVALWAASTGRFMTLNLDSSRLPA